MLILLSLSRLAWGCGTELNDRDDNSDPDDDDVDNDDPFASSLELARRNDLAVVNLILDTRMKY